MAIPAFSIPAMRLPLPAAGRAAKPPFCTAPWDRPPAIATVTAREDHPNSRPATAAAARENLI